MSDRAPDIRRWLPAAYFLGFVLFIAPFTETLGALWPPQFDSAPWRYGAVGVFLSFAGSAPLGLLCVLFAARELGHRVVMQAVGILAIIMTLAILMACGAFALDVIQVRPMVKPVVKGGFDLAAGKSVALALVVMVTCIFLAMAAFKSAVPQTRHRPRRTDGGADLVVGEPVSPLE